jgi:Family of unknown function (DUF5681)
MSQSKPKDRGFRSYATGNHALRGDYVIGKGRPPVHSRWRPGQSGNPNGRPKGRRNVTSDLKKVASKAIAVRDGETERRLSLAAANLLAHGVKGAKGDSRSSTLFFNRLDKMGVLDCEEGAEDAASAQDALIVKSLTTELRPSDGLFEHLDPSLLSREEQIDLSRLAEVIDVGGDFTALSTGDFERVKHLVNKGRGTDVTPRNALPEEHP